MFAYTPAILVYRNLVRLDLLPDGVLGHGIEKSIESTLLFVLEHECLDGGVLDVQRFCDVHHHHSVDLKLVDDVDTMGLS